MFIFNDEVISGDICCILPCISTHLNAKPLEIHHAPESELLRLQEPLSKSRETKGSIIVNQHINLIEFHDFMS